LPFSFFFFFVFFFMNKHEQSDEERAELDEWMDGRMDGMDE
jgi:hypothetical protein